MAGQRLQDAAAIGAGATVGAASLFDMVHQGLSLVLVVLSIGFLCWRWYAAAKDRKKRQSQ